METNQSVQIIERMLSESRRSLHRNSFYFILWGFLLIPAVLLEFYLQGSKFNWVGWPILSTIGGIISGIYGRKEDKRAGVSTFSDRVTVFTWGSFGFVLIFSIVFSVYNHLSPYPLVLMAAGMATFISGGISKFKPFIYGGIALELGAIACAFFVKSSQHGVVFIACMLLGYIIPGILLRKIENEQA